MERRVIDDDHGAAELPVGSHQVSKKGSEEEEG